MTRHAELTCALADITTLDVDVVVNAANERMLGGGGVDGAIHRAAGPGLLQACRSVEEVRPGVRCPAGEARITAAFDLPARWVVHTVGPVWRGGAAGEANVLADAYRSSLELAIDVGARTVAFPAISTGVYGYPPEAAATVAVGACLDVLTDRPGELVRVILTAFDDETLAVLERASLGGPAELGGEERAKFRDSLRV